MAGPEAVDEVQLVAAALAHGLAALVVENRAVIGTAAAEHGEQLRDAGILAALPQGPAVLLDPAAE